MPGTILVCYDVETASQHTLGFFEGATAMHEELDIPCTMFLTGTTMDFCPDACQAAGRHPLISLGQHTYSHVLLKTVYMQPGDGKPCSHTDGDLTFLIEGDDLETIRADVSRAQQLFENLFGEPCRGLTAPWGAYRGLMDRPACRPTAVVNPTEEAEVATAEVVDDLVLGIVLHRENTHPVDVLGPEPTVLEGINDPA